MKSQRDGLFHKIYANLYRPMDVAGLAIVRMLFGLIIIYEVVRYMDLGRIASQYTRAEFQFKYMFFEWVKPLSTQGMFWVFVAYGIAGICITLGIFYHVAAVVAFLSISYIFLIDATNYLNHFYLVIIYSAMMIFIPCYKGWSLYALIHRKKASQTTPGWGVWLIRSEIALVYFYAALAKMNVDWFNGMPLHNWLGNKTHEGGIFSLFSEPMTIYFFAYGGFIFDLLIAPALLWKRTRAFSFFFVMFFHLTNYFVFNIGIFPWFMLATSTLFFDTSWPRVWLNRIFPKHFKPFVIPEQEITPPTWPRTAWLSIMGAHMAFQILFPLRHFLYPGYVAWTEEGHDFSWHMKLRGKTGKTQFTIKYPETGETVVVQPQQYLSRRQYSKMSGRPSHILQFAHYLRDKYTLPGQKPVEVYVESKVRLNGRKAQRLIDPDVNMSNIEDSLLYKSWILPMRQPVWNAENKRNRFGPALVMDDIARKAIHKFSKDRPDNMKGSETPKQF